MAMKKWLAAVFAICVFSGCITTPPPTEEYALARAAMDAAKAVEAARYSPGHWHQAEQSYRYAETLYQDHEFAKAQKEFVKARVAAERAENSARLIRQKNGEVL